MSASHVHGPGCDCPSSTGAFVDPQDSAEYYERQLESLRGDLRAVILEYSGVTHPVGLNIISDRLRKILNRNLAS